MDRFPGGRSPVNKAGDAMTGALTLPGAPTANLHAATKLYVDSAVAGVSVPDLSSYVKTTTAIALSIVL
ncbi:MAG: hypothetical protein M3Q10_11800 [Chloroflexota bacterium]|nr:hypothetical protein [Chloroflexota bacterium]